MGVYIKEMEKPKKCRTCNFKSNKEGECWFVHDENDCPLIDIVTCGECSRRKKNGFCLEHNRYERNDDGFCNYGERRADEHNT